MRLSIVMPVLDDAAALAGRLQALQVFRQRGAELIVVDGGSRDASMDVARHGADRVLQAPRGRASQMNAGAACAQGDVLLFLHADTVLPDDADQAIERALAHGADWGRFDVRIVGRHPLLPMVAWLMNGRSRLTGIATGDQGLFVRTALFRRLGGFDPLPLMEDVALSARLRRAAPVAALRERVQTDGRRWDTHGLWRTVWLMWGLRLRFALGADAQTLARRYGYTPRADAALAIMARSPVPGQAKTRLMPLLGARGAARAHRALVLHTLTTVRVASLGPAIIWCAPDDQHRLWCVLRERAGWRTRVQQGADLGERMAHAMAAHFAQSQRAWIVVGTDAPSLNPDVLQQLADALQHHDVGMVPAEDGGYVALGLRRAIAGVFRDIHWGSASVAEATRARCAQLGLSLWEGPLLWDVDHPSDWQRWLAIQSASR
ncbi:MAG: TIGR04283 family arsenosugar biosynthesis glycosyltransferase [Hydrogenophaga sp.]|uniref:TIGR04283 family arsenosugar biosynthesis glycosyltransferase n=1 Tax=Hydrogenophaga sp. TaxID=1904254 RepID=UPI001D9F4F70|nr:TIGR04283 family arsenosugar biosynthesis glycosyltransferase [Hydrogenophaga sp.]MBX3610792.1 TIGR04283 family arsenosugar biosynthesis glycosyltransferase [Hydrogenophaga sp.]